MINFLLGCAFSLVVVRVYKFLSSRPATRTHATRWRTAYFCVACNEELSWDEMMNSDGTCPECGHRGEDAMTIIDISARVYRYEYGKRVFKDGGVA